MAQQYRIHIESIDLVRSLATILTFGQSGFFAVEDDESFVLLPNRLQGGHLEEIVGSGESKVSELFLNEIDQNFVVSQRLHADGKPMEIQEHDLVLGNFQESANVLKNR